MFLLKFIFLHITKNDNYFKFLNYQKQDITNLKEKNGTVLNRNLTFSNWKKIEKEKNIKLVLEK